MTFPQVTLADWRAQVEKELFLALLQQALHLVLQQYIAPGTQGDVAGHLYHRHVAYCPLVKLHGSSDPRKVQEGVILSQRSFFWASR